MTATAGLVWRLGAFFLAASVLGWCVDTLLRSVRRRRFAPIRRVPFSPLYGVACLGLWAAPSAVGTAAWWLQFLAFALFICAFEYAAGAMILLVRGTRMWDYTDRYCHVSGHTDRFHFFLWGTLGVIAYRWALPALASPLGLAAHLR